MFVTLWAFEVKGGREAAFEKEYGPEGAWAQFFGKDPAYRGMSLSRDIAQPRSYYTMDFWMTRGAYESFREKHSGEYAKIDAACAALTARETPLGTFESPLADIASKGR